MGSKKQADFNAAEMDRDRLASKKGSINSTKNRDKNWDKNRDKKPANKKGRKKQNPHGMSLGSSEDKKFNQGNGYYLPAGVTVNQWRALKKKWDEKLANSGFVDIEYFSPAMDGKFSPYFGKRIGRSISRNSADLLKTWSWDKEEYYRFASVFMHHFDWQSLGKTIPPLERLKKIWELHCEGFSQTEISAAMGNSVKRSVIGQRIRSLKAIMLEWHKTSPKGMLGGQDGDF